MTPEIPFSYPSNKINGLSYFSNKKRSNNAYSITNRPQSKSLSHIKMHFIFWYQRLSFAKHWWVWVPYKIHSPPLFLLPHRKSKVRQKSTLFKSRLVSSHTISIVLFQILEVSSSCFRRSFQIHILRTGNLLTSSTPPPFWRKVGQRILEKSHYIIETTWPWSSLWFIIMAGIVDSEKCVQHRNLSSMALNVIVWGFPVFLIGSKKLALIIDSLTV